MKHFLIAVLLISLMLAFCVWSASAITEAAQPVGKLLTAAQKAAREGSFDAAGKFAEMADAAWQENEVLFGILLRHDETDAVMRQFAALKEYASAKDGDDFSAACAELLRQVRHVQSMQLPTVENIL